MGSVGDQQLALKLVTSPVLVPGDENVCGESREQEHEAEVGHLDCVPAADESPDCAPRELNARDGEEDDDPKGTERFEFPVTVGVLFIRSLRCNAHHDQAEDIVDRVDRGVDRIADDGERAGHDAERRFSDDDQDVGDE